MAIKFCAKFCCAEDFKKTVVVKNGVPGTKVFDFANNALKINGMDKIYECFEIKLSGPFDIEYQVKDGAFIKEDQIHSIKFYEISEKTDDHCEILHDLDAGRKKNVLILGETGVGKCPWFNAFANYVTFASMDEARYANNHICLVPTSFEVNRKGNPLLVQTCNVEGSDENINSAKSTTGMTKPRVFETAESGRLRLIKTRGIRHTDRSAGQHAVVDWHKPLISNNSRSCFFITLGLVCFLGCLAVYAVNRTAKLLLVLLSVSSASFIAFGICIRLPKISDAYVYFIKALVPISMYYAAVGVHESLEDKSRTFTYVVGSRVVLIIIWSSCVLAIRFRAGEDPMNELGTIYLFVVALFFSHFTAFHTTPLQQVQKEDEPQPANMRAMGKELQEAKKTILTLRDDNKKLRSKMWKDYLCVGMIVFSTILTTLFVQFIAIPSFYE